jgi:L-histidine Nalpha-methyltransferase
MSFVVNVGIHESQSPEKVRRDLLDSLKNRQINHKFHYDSYKQSQKWLALHQAYSPSRTDADCSECYERSFEAAAQSIQGPAHLIGLGCGGGQKDVRLLGILKRKTQQVSYTPCDVSLALVLTAQRAASNLLPENACHPLVCDLASADNLPQIFDTGDCQTTRLITFFGMIPNFEPSLILPRLASLLKHSDWLLFSANLSPGADYEAGIQRILPGYDNALTRDWLMTFLLDLGIEESDGGVQFSIKNGEENLKRIVAEFQFSKDRNVNLDSETFHFSRGETIRLFFSYRYTPERVCNLLAQHGLSVINQWITKSEEEGVFLCQKNI